MRGDIVRNFTVGAGALSDYAVVEMDTDGNIVVSSDVSSSLGVVSGIGVAAGERVDVRLGGIGKAVAGGAFAAGASLDVADGKVIVASAASGNAKFTALEAATAVGDLVDVLVR